jgi:hypothetical protein
MARASVTTQSVVRTGLNPALTAPTVDGDIIDAGNVFLWVKNDDDASITVTVQTPTTQDGLALADLTVTVGAAAQRLIGPLPPRSFSQASDAEIGASRVLVDYSAVTDVTRGVFKIG